MATLDNTLITAGESVQIALQVENAGEQGGTFQANLTVDSETVDSQSITVEAGEDRTIVFNYRFDDPGEYEIGVADTSLGPLIVTSAGEDKTVTAEGEDKTVTNRPDTDTDGTRTRPIEVTDATVPWDWVKKGYDPTVRAAVVNRADRTANRTLTVTVDDQPVATETVTLRAGERAVVAIEFEAVSGTVAVEGIDAGRISVGEGPGTVRTETDAAEYAGVWSELGIAVFVGGVVILVSAIGSHFIRL